MKIILRENVEKLGLMGEIVEVKNGYARNYLIPTEKAYPAIDSYTNIIRGEIETKRKIMEQERDKALVAAKDMEDISVTIEVAVGEEDKMFGSVTNQHIAAKLLEIGHEVDRKKLVLDHPIKALGIYHVPLKLHYDVSVDIKVKVIKELEASLSEAAPAVEEAAEEVAPEVEAVEEAVEEAAPEVEAVEEAAEEAAPEAEAVEEVTEEAAPEVEAVEEVAEEAAPEAEAVEEVAEEAAPEAEAVEEVAEEAAPEAEKAKDEEKDADKA